MEKDQDKSPELEVSEVKPLLGSSNPVLANNTKSIFYSGFCCIPFFIAVAVILSQSDDDCSNPIRFWLEVLGVTYMVSILVGLFECFTGLLSKAGYWMAVPFLLFSLFEFAWFVVGCVWLFSDTSCKDDWYDGYVLTLVLLIFFFIFLGFLLVLSCCFLCCAGIFSGIFGAFTLMEAQNRLERTN